MAAPALPVNSSRSGGLVPGRLNSSPLLALGRDDLRDSPEADPAVVRGLLATGRLG